MQTDAANQHLLADLASGKDLHLTCIIILLHCKPYCIPSLLQSIACWLKMYAVQAADDTPLCYSQHAITYAPYTVNTWSFTLVQIFSGWLQVLQCQGSMQTLGRRPGTKLASGTCTSSRCAFLPCLSGGCYVCHPGWVGGKRGEGGEQVGRSTQEVKSGSLPPSPGSKCTS